MKNNCRGLVTCTALLCMVLAGLAYGETNGKKMKVDGLIIDRSGENLTVKTFKGSTNVTVVLADETKVEIPKGLLKLRHSDQAITALIPGLKVSVSGVGTDTRVVAKTIKITKDDLRLAETIQAGLNPTQQQQQTNMSNIASNKQNIEVNNAASEQRSADNKAGIEANQSDIAANQQDIEAANKRFSDLSEYDVKAAVTIHFPSSSSTIPADEEALLVDTAKTASSLSGYIIQVKGYADSSGDAAMNQQLSMDRAQAVVAFLLQNCQIPLRHIVAPGAMGEAAPISTNEDPNGRAENRRVEVKVLVNRGVAGGM
ncbi:MAG: OmpA family protein [Terriglobales bacterium]